MKVLLIKKSEILHPVLINGFLYWVDDIKNKVYNLRKTSYVEYKHLSSSEKKQVYNCINFESDRENVKNYLKRYYDTHSFSTIQ